MKVGIIDLGTNTFNILIAEIKADKNFEILLNTKSPVMLGSEGINEGYISDKAFTRAYGVIRDFSKLINQLKCDKVLAFGTSAIRSASNSSDFIGKIKSDFDIDIETISGDQEATYIYEGVKQAVEFTEEKYLILDIGGGSNEFIIADKTGVLWQHSFPLGGARLLDKIKPSDPIASGEIETLNQLLEKELGLLGDALEKYAVTQLVGSSGAFDSFAKINYRKKHDQPMPQDLINNEITIDEFQAIYDDLIPTQRIERLMLAGLESIRVDTIVMSALFTDFTLKMSKVKGIIRSAFSLKEGVVANFIQ